MMPVRAGIDLEALYVLTAVALIALAAVVWWVPGLPRAPW